MYIIQLVTCHISEFIDGLITVNLCISFGYAFFLEPLAMVSIRQLKYIAKFAIIKV